MGLLLEGRAVVVTGASRGIGRGVAEACAAAGGRVAISGRDRAALDEVAQSIAVAGGEAHVVPADLTDPDDVDSLRREVERLIGTPDVLVANAGGSTVRPGPLESISPEQWSASISTNLTATFLTVRAFLPGMKARRSGAIVTVSSAAARRPDPRSPAAYAAAKAGVEYLTQLVAAQAGPYGVRANCIAPETILTARNQAQIPADVQAELISQHPIRRLGTVEDVSDAVLYLASEQSAWVSGVVLDVAGGSVLR